MLGAYASLALICAASLLVGQAILSLCGRRGLSWLSGPVGLAAIIVASGIAIKLPGHATAVAITLAALLVASMIWLAAGSPGTPPANASHPYYAPSSRPCCGSSLGALPATLPALGAAGLAVIVASVPFVVNGKVGILGVGLVNDDMASHLLIADWLGSRVGDMPALIHQGYPVGPHSLVAGLHTGLGIGLIEAFAGLTLAIPALTALVAFEALEGLRRVPRILVAALVALPYLAAAYLAQEAFKEPIEALFLLSFALLLPAATTARRAVPLGVIAAGAVYAYSFPGLFWLAGTAAIYAAVAWMRGTRGGHPADFRSTDARTVRSRDAKRSPEAYPVALAAVGAIGVLLVLTAPEWSRMIDFTHFRAFRNSALSQGLGNLRHQLSPLEALGIWPASDFRLSASAASVPAPVFYLGGLIAAAALAIGLPRWLRRHGPAVPAALATAAVIYLGARVFGTVYTSAKALAIAAPLLTLISLGGLLEHEKRSEGGEGTPGADPAKGGAGAGPATFRGMSATSRRRDILRGRWRGRRRAPMPGGRVALLLATALGVGIALSSFLVLRQAPVAPQDHASQLAELRPLVEGHRVLFLGRDNFVAYELRGARPFTAVRNFYDPNYVKPDLRLHDVFQKFDFDSVTPAALGRFPFAITTRAAYASGPPPAFEPVRETRDFVLWKRTGPVGPRRTLAEGASPGAVLRCSTKAGRRAARAGGAATAFSPPPVVGGRWSPSSTVEGGSPVTQSLTIAPGRWEVSISYDATRPLHVSAPGLAATLPANLDYRGSVPFYPVGELTVPLRGFGATTRFTVTVERPPLAGRLLGTKSEAHLGAIALTRGAGGPLPGAAERRVPLRRACRGYVDWYRPAGGH